MSLPLTWRRWGCRLREATGSLKSAPSDGLGKGFDRIDLQVKRPFFFSFQIIDAVRRELSWAYYQFLF
jgi:hypothetical protein